MTVCVFHTCVCGIAGDLDVHGDHCQPVGGLGAL